MSAVIILAANLRTGVSSLAPVLSDVAGALHVSTSTVGILTALPGFCFAAFGFLAVPISRKVGLTPTLLAGTIAITAGLAVRPWLSSFAAFFLATVLVVAGIALANVLLPAWIKNTHTPVPVVTVMAAYTTVLAASGALGPLTALVFADWKMTLWAWTIPAAAAVVAWIAVWRRVGTDFPRSAAPQEIPAEVLHEEPVLPARPIFTSLTAWALLVFFALQSSAAYVQMGWLPTILEDRGVAAATASWALILIGAVSVVGGPLMDILAARLRNLMPVPIVLASTTVAGWLGIYLDAAAAPLLWGLLLGIGGLCFPLVLSLLAQRTASPLVTARLSGFVQPGGYLIAGLVPFGVGVLYSRLGQWDAILLCLMSMAVLMVFVGAFASRNVVIDDELKLDH